MGGRVVWTSSLAASPSYESEDWQLIKTEQSYESSKYQIDLMATHLDFRARKVLDENPASHPVRHFISEPGVCSTNIAIALAAPGVRFMEVCLCYLVGQVSSFAFFFDIHDCRLAFWALFIILSNPTKLLSLLSISSSLHYGFLLFLLSPFATERRQTGGAKNMLACHQ